MKLRISQAIITVFLFSMICFSAEPAEEVVGKRPYEMEWAGRTEDDREPLVDFENLDGWTVDTQNAVGSFQISRQEQIWDKYVGKLTYRAKGDSPIVIIRPPAPIKLTVPFDSINLWVYGNNWHYIPDPETPQAAIFMLLKNPDGQITEAPMGLVFWSGWWVMHCKLLDKQLATIEEGVVLDGIKIVNGTNTQDRVLYFDNLVIYKEELKPLKFDPRPKRGIEMFPGQSEGTNTGPGKLPFPTREETLLPTNNTKDFQTTVKESDGSYEFTYKGSDGELKYTYKPDTGDLSDITVQWNSHEPFKPMVDGGIYFDINDNPKPSLVECTKNGDEVISTWKYMVGDKPADVIYTFRLWQKSLVVDVKCLGGFVREFNIGKAVGVKNPRLIKIPYLVGAESRPAVMVTGPETNSIFTMALMDHTRSNSSELWFVNNLTDEGVFYNGGSKYFPKTDGKRNDCFERLFLTVSADFDEVLPNVPNPKSPWMGVAGKKMWWVLGSHDREEQYNFLKEVTRYGMTELVLTDHETGWRDDYESFTLRTRTAPGKGGDESQALYAQRMHDLGFVYGLYNNYTDYIPVNEHWSEDGVTRRSDGTWMTAWPRCYNLKPARAVELEAKIAPIIKSKFKVSTAYCDVHSAMMPWYYLDYDARVPGAGSFISTFYSYGEIFLHQKEVWGGPVYSEGGHHWYYCGLVDGNYAQDRQMLLSQNPWLVNFDLLKLHPLSCNFGMGGIGMFYGPSYGISGMPNGTIEEVDHFIAATLAFGHTGFLVFSLDMPGAIQSYYTIQQVFSRYTEQEVTDIRYGDSSGNLIDVSKAVAAGEYKRSQIVTTYQDGYKVTVNGNQKETWNIEGNELPPNGWFVDDPSGKVTAFGKAVDGRRVDYVDSPAYIYANARGEITRFEKCICDGQLIATKLDDGSFEVIPVNCSVFGVSIAGSAGKAVAFDKDRKEIGPVETRLGRGMVYIIPVEGAFSYTLKSADCKVSVLKCSRDRVIPGEEVTVTCGKKKQTITIPSDVEPGTLYWHQLKDSWIDFVILEPFKAAVAFKDGIITLSLTSQMASKVYSNVEFNGETRSIKLIPGNETQLKYKVKSLGSEPSRDLILKVTAADMIFCRKWTMQVTKEIVPVAKRPSEFYAGQCIRGKSEEPIDIQSGAQVLWDIGVCGGVTKEAFLMGPPWRQDETGYVYALYEGIELPKEPKAAFRCSIGKHDGSYPGDGILFKLAVIGENGKETIVAEKHWAKHSWTDLEADLSAWAGEKIKLKLISDPGKDDNSEGDWPRWGDIKIESITPQMKVTLKQAVVECCDKPAEEKK